MFQDGNRCNNSIPPLIALLEINLLENVTSYFGQGVPAVELSCIQRNRQIMLTIVNDACYHEGIKTQATNMGNIGNLLDVSLHCLSYLSLQIALDVFLSLLLRALKLDMTVLFTIISCSRCLFAPIRFFLLIIVSNNPSSFGKKAWRWGYDLMPVSILNTFFMPWCCLLTTFAQDIEPVQTFQYTGDIYPEVNQTGDLIYPDFL